MYLSKLEGKEIINLYDGSRLGVLGNAELFVDPENGDIKALILPTLHRLFKFQSGEEITIPWESIRKIGSDMMLVELQPVQGQSRKERRERYNYRRPGNNSS